MKKIIIWLLISTFFVWNTFAKDCIDFRLINWFNSNEAKKYKNLFCENKKQEENKINIFQELYDENFVNLNHISWDKEFEKVKTIFKIFEEKKDWRRYLTFFVNGEKKFEIDFKETADKFLPFVSFSNYNYGNHIFYYFTKYEAEQKVVYDREKYWIYLNWKQILKNVDWGYASEMIESSYLKKLFLKEKFWDKYYKILWDLKKIELSKEEKQKADKILEKLLFLEFSKDKKEEVMKIFENYLEDFEKEIISKKVTEESYKKFLKIYYVYTELFIKDLMK